jgi:hypothetical protein
MIPQATRFPIFILVSLVVFIGILLFVTRRRDTHPSTTSIAMVAGIVVIGGMIFAKFGQNAGWPWWVYYTVPAGVTLLLPALAFRFTVSELWRYLLLAAASSPVIHVAFSFLLDWHDYMPFLNVPSLQSLLR